MSQIINCKVVILGDSSTGKTSIANRYVKEKFEQYEEPTIGASFLKKNISIGKSIISYEIWDTAGQERYRSLAPMYYRNAKVALVVFDITNNKSLTSAIEWIKEINEKCEDIIIALLGNKCDLENNINNKEIINELIDLYNLNYFETSAKDNVNIGDVFDKISEKLISYGFEKKKNLSIKISDKKEITKNACC